MPQVHQQHPQWFKLEVNEINDAIHQWVRYLHYNIQALKNEIKDIEQLKKSQIDFITDLGKQLKKAYKINEYKKFIKQK